NIHALGDGGAVTTNNEVLYRRLLRLRNHGLGEDGMVYEPGFNSRLDEIQAAIISIQLDHLEDITQRKRKIA
ncbi:MAG: DegT/DnrJ/EryC1/StrS family aminotransferase, partial [Deltaproteobacteria bacterium]|nr:DegT/DnrJ/EryC1/StrS family aminotransferase [Deltaproteobacteria bacterium]